MNRTPRKPLPRPHEHGPHERGPGLFVPQHVIVTLACLIPGIAAGVLVWLTPAVWPPVDAAVAVTGLSLALYGLRRGRHRP